MRLIRPAFLLIVLFALVASGLGDSRAEDPFIQPKEKGGPLVHRYSRFSFPAQLGRFHRLPPHQFDASGRDVSVGYNLDFPPVAVTLYVYPAGVASLEQEFARRQQELIGAHPSAKLVEQGPTMVSPRKVPALSAEYIYADQFAGTSQPLRSTLLVSRSGEYFVEYRISHTADSAPVASKLVRQLVQEFAYP